MTRRTPPNAILHVSIVILRVCYWLWPLFALGNALHLYRYALPIYDVVVLSLLSGLGWRYLMRILIGTFEEAKKE
jgi:hypothetical protein